MVGRARAPEGSALTLSEPDAALSEELAGGMVEGCFDGGHEDVHLCSPWGRVFRLVCEQMLEM